MYLRDGVSHLYLVLMSVSGTFVLYWHGGPHRDKLWGNQRLVQLFCFFKPVRGFFAFRFAVPTVSVGWSLVEAECKKSMLLKPLIKVLCQKMLWKKTFVQVDLEKEYNLHEQTYN